MKLSKIGSKPSLISALLLSFHLASPVYSQVAVMDVERFEQNNPELYSWIDENTQEAVRKEAQIKIAATIIRLLEAEQMRPFLASFIVLDKASITALLTEPGGPLTKVPNDITSVAAGAFQDIVVDLSSEYAVGVILSAPIFSDIPDEFIRPLERAIVAAIKETVSVMTHEGPLQTLVLVKTLERAQDAIEIYQATGALAKAETGALISLALFVASTAEISVEVGGERGQRLVDLTRRDIANTMPQAVGSDDAEAVTEMYDAALDALIAYHRRDVIAANGSYQEILTIAGSNRLGPLSLLRNPFDWGVAAMNLGKDSPEIALEVLLTTTELANVGRGEIAPIAAQRLTPDIAQRPAAPQEAADAETTQEDQRFSVATPQGLGSFEVFYGDRYLQIASRRTLEEAQDFAKTYSDGPDAPRIFRTENGWFAITGALLTRYGGFSDEEFVDLVSQVISENGFPEDAYLTSGKGFVELMPSSPDTQILNPYFIRTKTIRQTSSFFSMEVNGVLEYTQLGYDVGANFDVVVWYEDGDYCGLSIHEPENVKCSDLEIYAQAESFSTNPVSTLSEGEASPAQATNASAVDLSTCTSIENDIARLECFEQLAQTETASLPSPQQALNEFLAIASIDEQRTELWYTPVGHPCVLRGRSVSINPQSGNGHVVAIEFFNDLRNVREIKTRESWGTLRGLGMFHFGGIPRAVRLVNVRGTSGYFVIYKGIVGANTTASSINLRSLQETMRYEGREAAFAVMANAYSVDEALGVEALLALHDACVSQ